MFCSRSPSSGFYFTHLNCRYPNYNFIGSALHQKSDLFSRWNQEGFRQIIIDISMLSRCDYLVCTGSSNVGIYQLYYIYMLGPGMTNISVMLKLIMGGLYPMQVKNLTYIKYLLKAKNGYEIKTPTLSLQV